MKTISVRERKYQSLRLLTQMAFFALFVLAPIFDLLRYDLTRGHAYLLGFEWHLGLDDFLGGRVGAARTALNMGMGLFLPALGVAALVLGVAWKWGRLYCGWLCPHFSVVETINRLMIVATGKHSIWDKWPVPKIDADGAPIKRDRRAWLILVPLVVAFAFTWAVVFLTYLMPPLEVYPRLFAFSLSRNESIFVVAATVVLSFEFLFARHLFCRYACAVGMFQSLAWMGNRKALVIGVDRNRLAECATCLDGQGSACDAACPMRIKPRTLKRWMFTCTQCAQCIDACATVNHDKPEGSLLVWVKGEEAKQREAGFSALTHKRPEES